MIRFVTLLTGSLILLAVLAASQAHAGSAPGDCSDLGGIAETPAVDYVARIRLILDGCTACHDENAAGGLDLRPGNAYDNLVGVQSTTRPGQLRVEPFNPGDSVLMIAINCSSPNGPAFQMPGTDESERALIRDWIAQGALPEPAGTVAVPVAGPRAIAAMIALLMLLAAFQLGRNRSA